MRIVAPGKHDIELAALRRASGQASAIAATAEFGTTALFLVWVRATHEGEWEDLQASRDPGASGLARLFWNTRGLGIEGTTRILRDLPGAALAEIIEVVDWAARRLSNAGAFRLILENFAWDGGVLTPDSIAAIMTNTVDIASASTVYDPFCRAGELLLAAASGTRKSPLQSRVSVYGDTPDLRSLEIAEMNTQVHQVDADLGQRSILEDAYSTSRIRRFSRILTNPPFNASHWAQGDYAHWHYGPPPKNNANFAWLQYAVERLEPGGKAAVVMANGAGTSANPRERLIRELMIADGCVEGLISLPPQLFRGTAVPATIWLLDPPGTRRGEVLFIDASSAGFMASRTIREFSYREIDEITQIVEDWRSRQLSDEPGETISSASVPLAEIRERDYLLNPSAYVPQLRAEHSRDTTLPEIQHLIERLEAAHEDAREKDTRALQFLKDLMQ